MPTEKRSDADFCGSVPLHHINVIQPYGVLVVVRKTDLQVVQVSENIKDICDLSAVDAVESNLARLIPASQAEKLRSLFKEGVTQKLPITISMTRKGSPQELLCLVHERNDHFLLEIERLQEHATHDSSFIAVYQELKYIMADISLARSIPDVCDAAIAGLKKLSGFDRILVYQFDEQWNGNVIAEKLSEGMDSYYGLRFPASDIPKQARALYYRNPYRLIPDRDYTPVKLYPVINPLTHAFIDLSDCNIRGVAAVHLEYMKNMNTVASMSTRILVDDKLWGLISCHHRTAKYLGYELCSAFELLSGVISERISSLQNKKQLEDAASLQDTQARLVQELYKSADGLQSLLGGTGTMTNLLDVEGVVLCSNGNIIAEGKVPSETQIEDLVFWLQNKDVDQVYTTTNLSAEYDNAEAFTNVASGIIAMPLNARKGEYIIGFRPEVIQQVQWGGNPNEAIQFESDGQSYHPRNSFRVWQQTVKNTSKPWSRQDIISAKSFRNFLLEYSLKKAQEHSA